MKNQELSTYIKNQLQQGVTPEDIRTVLRNSGWPNDHVEAAFADADSYPQEVPPLSPIQDTNKLPTLTKLPSISDQISRTIAVFKANWQRFVGMALLPMALSFGFLFVVAAFLVAGGIVTYLSKDVISSEFLIPAVVVGVIVLLVFAIISNWLQIGMIILALNEGRISVSAALAQAKSMIWGYVLVSILAALMVFGGGLLLLVPAIIFAAWFAFAPLVMINEGKRGLSALMLSREYVRGYWVSVLSRLMGVTFLLGIVSTCFTYIFETTNLSALGGIASFLFSLIAAPLMIIFWTVLFKDLRSLRGEVDLSVPGKRRLKYLIVTIIGLMGALLIPALIVVSVLSIINPGK